MRLGVAGALVDGELLAGDVEVDSLGTVVEVGIGAGDGSLLAVPGLVDLQINGAAGVDLRVAERDGYQVAATALAGRGATAVQPTFHSQPLDAHLDSLEPGRGAAGPSARVPHPAGAPRRPLPVAAPAWRTSAQHLLAPDLGVLRRLLAAGPVGMMTLAPELEGAERLIASWSRRASW